MPGLRFNSGNVLLSHTLARAVPSGLQGLTSVFGMGTGGTPALQSPKSWLWANAGATELVGRLAVAAGFSYRPLPTTYAFSNIDGQHLLCLYLQ
jgi:hypothetical protein